MTMDDRTLLTETRAIAASRGRAERDDLAQDLALALIEAGGAARRPGAWLERVARNAVIDRRRVETRRSDLAPSIDPPGAPPDPESALLGRERRSLVRRALAALPRLQRRATLARFAADLPFDEVARRMGIETVTARTRVHRALAVLRAQLGSLRTVLALPGLNASALGLTLLAAAAPARTAPPRSLPASIAEASDVSQRARRRALAPTSPPPPAPAPTSAPASTGTTTSTTPRTAPALVPKRGSGSETDQPASPRPDPIASPQTFVFDNDSIEGSTVGPEGEPIVVVRPTPQPSLIELRRHFIGEIVKSMEEL